MTFTWEGICLALIAVALWLIFLFGEPTWRASYAASRLRARTSRFTAIGSSVNISP